MKKKKPPIVLASSLIVLVGAAIILFPKEQDPNQPPPQNNSDVKPVGQSRPTPSKAEVEMKLKGSNQQRPMAPMDDAEGPPTTMANAPIPTIFIPKAIGPNKQTPNDATVAAQWYRPDARAGRKEGTR